MNKKFIGLLLAVSPMGLALADTKSEDKMKAMMELSMPGEFHKKLAAAKGSWSYTSVWRESANSPEEKSTGTAVMTMTFGERFLQQDVKGTAMKRPFTGRGTVGYNNATMQYETSWIDNMSTAMVRGTSKYDQANDVFAESGEFYCPGNGSKATPYRAEWKMIGKNEQSYTMFIKDKETGKEFETMKMTYKRVK